MTSTVGVNETIKTYPLTIPMKVLSADENRSAFAMPLLSMQNKRTCKKTKQKRTNCILTKIALG